VFALKRRWKVAAAAIVRRAYDLRLIDARQYRIANVFISKKGWKRGEPEEPEEERPELLHRAFDHLAQRDGIMPYEAARELRWWPETFERVTGSSLLRRPLR
jgi:Zn-dependent peptidase ImmA (M78 family)